MQELVNTIPSIPSIPLIPPVPSFQSSTQNTIFSALTPYIPWAIVPAWFFLLPSWSIIVGIIIFIIIVIICIAWVYRWYQHLCHQHRRKIVDKQCRSTPFDQSIFISMPSYRDTQCAETLFDLFEKAYCPFRITVGVCQQNAPIDEDIIVAYKKLAASGINDFSDRIRIIRLDAGEAKGPMYARHLIEKNLFRGEQFYMNVDSHMLFTPNWDKHLIEEWNICAQLSAKPVITMYPEDFKAHNRTIPMYNYEKTAGSYLRLKKFNEKTGVIEIEGPSFMRIPNTPVPSLFWAACFSFGPSSMVQEVPFDPYCDYVFFGEEISMAARLWTSGYDLYNPMKMHCYHMWERNRPTYLSQFNDNSNEKHKERQILEAAGYDRIKKILHMSNEPVTVLPPYGMGTVRPFEEYEKLIGIHMKDQKFTSTSGIMGLLDTASAQEILCKFGTWKNFENAKNTILKNMPGYFNK